MQFSQELIQQMQRYFADKYGKVITSEEAEAYLNSWADLFLTIGGTASGGRKAR